MSYPSNSVVPALRWSLPLLLVLLCGGRVVAGDPNADAIEAISSPQQVLEALTCAEGYEVNLFASEQEFLLHNPLALRFDSEGRAWVAVSPTYPMLLPGTPPNDKLLVLEDTNNDGVADKQTVFADGLYIPTGFAIDTQGRVYVAQQPNLWLLEDTDGDLRADRRSVIVQGFGTEDSHHSLSAFSWGPDGSFYFNEGVFHHTQVETPWGPQRARDAAVFRFKAANHRLQVVSHHGYANPWGHAFDRWGQSVLSDASGGAHFNFASVIPAFDYPDKNVSTSSFFVRGRPTSGNLFLSSGHFPEDVQGTHLNNQCIGFHGTRWDRLVDEGSGWRNVPLPDLVRSSDYNFRPVDSAIGARGDLFILDWCNPRIGHMQYTHRDPHRDHTHGRIWRITATGRPLLDPPQIVEASVSSLLALLHAPENHTRHFARRELQTRPEGEVIPLLEEWMGGLAADDDHGRLEALWVFEGRDVTRLDLMNTLLEARQPMARAAALRVLRFWLQEGRVDHAQALAWLQPRVEDSHERVRLEAVVACGFVPSAEAAGVALLASDHAMDNNFSAVLEQTLKVLAKYGVPNAKVGRQFQLSNMDPRTLASQPLDALVATTQLRRANVDREIRDRALQWLCQEWQLDRGGVLARILEESAARGRDPGPVVQWLDETPRSELAGATATLRKLAGSDAPDELRRAAVTALLRGGDKFEEVVASTLDVPLVLSAVAPIMDVDVLQSLYLSISVHLAQASMPLQDPPRGRFVRISLPRPGTLTLAEVQVVSGSRNIAPRGTAIQSAVAWGGVAERAIDGDTDGRYGQNSSTHTPEDRESPWWELDLGGVCPVEGIAIWNRTDAEFYQRLEGFTLELLDAERQRVWGKEGVAAPQVSGFYPLIEGSSLEERVAVMNAAARMPVKREQTFVVLSAIADGPQQTLKDAAIRAMNEVPWSAWPDDLRYQRYRFASVPADLMAAGEEVYQREGSCVTCHQKGGQGIPGSFPPLTNSPWLAGDPGLLVKMVLHGVQGKMVVNDVTYESNMEPLGEILSDAEIAAVLTYARNSFDNHASVVPAALVRRYRHEFAGRAMPWSVEELLASHPLPAASPKDRQEQLAEVLNLKWVAVSLVVICLGIGALMLFMYRGMEKEDRTQGAHTQNKPE